MKKVILVSSNCIVWNKSWGHWTFNGSRRGEICYVKWRKDNCRRRPLRFHYIWCIAIRLYSFDPRPKQLKSSAPPELQKTEVRSVHAAAWIGMHTHAHIATDCWTTVSDVHYTAHSELVLILPSFTTFRDRLLQLLQRLENSKLSSVQKLHRNKM